MGYSYATVKRPYISKVELEDEATSFLREHYQDALNYPLAVPIVQIASDMGIILLLLAKGRDLPTKSLVCTANRNFLTSLNTKQKALKLKAGVSLYFDENFRSGISS